MSAGVKAEVDLARSLGIPVFSDIQKLVEWRNMIEQKENTPQ
jgi:hypothetical protein